ncbi:hypothetical protein [Poseidonocella sp. HB161398]|uniref:hypothetical protein n=1 Tax=Poseidonocella sp. HB161398 TaxID=2320855 RepID=UPI0011092E52|nr:hypothetical protein [Poseidonocella sp. HB161398]
MNRVLPLAACAASLALPALAADPAALLVPAHPGLPIAHPVTVAAIAPPPFSTPDLRGVNPAYVPGLPGLPQGYAVSDDFGRKPLKYDGVLIRQSRIENGEVVIPPGGLAYLEDTWGGEVALRGEELPLLGRRPVYVDYDMSVVVQHDVTLPAGGSAVVGGTVYTYAASVGHETMANHTIHTRTIAGTDWEWAFGAPVLSETEPGWYGTRFAELYNQGQASRVTRQSIDFDWLSGVRMDRLLLADETVFKGLAAEGDRWAIGGRELRVASIDAAGGTVTVELSQDGKVIESKVLGPVDPDRLIEDTAARKQLVFEDGDIVAFLSPWPAPFEGERAQLKVYGGAFSLRYGDAYAGDGRFAVWPAGCPTGHNFGFMLTNREEIRLSPGQAHDGPEGYFRIVVDGLSGDAVTSWHVEDREGNRSLDLGGPQVHNIDLVLGQGRVAGQAILKDVGRDLLARTYGTAVAAQTAALPEGAPAPAAMPRPAAAAAGVSAGSGASPALFLALGIAAAAACGLGFELGRRRGGNGRA